MNQGLKPDDLGRLKCIGEPRVAPDGGRVAYTVSAPDKKSDRNLTSIWTVSLEGGRPKKLTNSGKDRSPKWSPNGERVAFISDRSGKSQIWLMDVDGGEAWMLSTEQRVRSFVWAPDGKSIAFTASDFAKSDEWVPYPGAPAGDRERAVAQAKQSLAGPKPSGGGNGADKSGAPKVPDVKIITRFKYRMDGMGYPGDLRSHIFVVRVPETAPESGEAKGHVRRLTAGDYDHDLPSFSPDSEYLVFAALRRDDADYLLSQDLWLVEVATGKLVHLLEGAGSCTAPAFSPDGKYLCFAGHDGAHGVTTQMGLWVVRVAEFMEEIKERGSLSSPQPLGQTDTVCLTRSLDRPLGPGSFSDVHYGFGFPLQWVDSSTLQYLVGDRGRGIMYRSTLSADGAWGEPKVVWGDEARNLVMFDCAGGNCVLQVGAPDSVEELFRFSEPDSALTRLTNTNPWHGRAPKGKTERITYKGADGWDIDGYLTYPVGYEPGKKYPTVLFIHGGPAGAYGPNYIHQFQAFASRGFAVLGTNPRGSTTYSQEFQSACVEDWGGKDYLDIMAGTDELIARGIADPDNLFVTGWSYGGFMTSWTVTQTDRFKAAVGGAIICNRHSMYSTSDITLFGEGYFLGNPWDNPDKLLERSAIAHVKNVKTPFMIIHGEEDVRCPVSQGEEMYLALKRLGKTAVFVRYPGEYHGLMRLSHKIDRLQRMVAWFSHYAEV